MSKSHGTVRWFANSKGYGFAVNDAGEDAFIHHYRSILGESYKTLSEDRQIEFIQVQSKRAGRLRKLRWRLYKTQINAHILRHYALHRPL